MYKISIIMAIYNVENYIVRSFNSILNQTMDLDDIEVIMVDDASTDNTRNIVKEYEEKYSNFKAIYHEKNSGGCAVPRNSGLDIATGKYIMFLDPDDEFAHDMCETLYNKIVNNDAEIVKCNHKLIDGNSSKIDYLYDKSIFEKKINCKNDLPPKSVSVCNAIHEKKFLDEKNIKFQDLKNGEELTFSIMEFLNANTIIVLNNYAGYKYYTNPESHQNKPSEKNLGYIIEACLISQKAIQQYNRTEISHHIFSIYCANFFMRLTNYHKNKKKYFTKFYEFEKTLDSPLTFDYMWMNIVNNILMDNRISFAVFVFNIFCWIRKTPLLKLYRKGSK